jgi:hypothetical protein
MKPNPFLPVFIEIAAKPVPTNHQELNESDLCAEDRLILRKLGFEQLHPDPAEPDYSEYKLCPGKHPLLQQVEATIAGTYIDIWAEEHQRGIAPGQKVMIASRAFTWYELAAVLKALSSNSV